MQFVWKDHNVDHLCQVNPGSLTSDQGTTRPRRNVSKVVCQLSCCQPLTQQRQTNDGIVGLRKRTFDDGMVSKRFASKKSCSSEANEDLSNNLRSTTFICTSRRESSDKKAVINDTPFQTLNKLNIKSHYFKSRNTANASTKKSLMMCSSPRSYKHSSTLVSGNCLTGKNWMDSNCEMSSKQYMCVSSGDLKLRIVQKPELVKKHSVAVAPISVKKHSGVSGGPGSVMKRSDEAIPIIPLSEDSLLVLKNSDELVSVIQPSDESLLVMKNSDEMVSVIQSSDESLLVMKNSDEMVSVIQSSDESLVVMKNSDEMVSVIQSSDESLLVMKNSDEMVSVIQPRDESLLVMKKSDEMVSVIQSSDESLLVMKNSDEMVSVIQPRDESLLVMKKSDEMVSVIQPSDESLLVMKISDELEPVMLSMLPSFTPFLFPKHRDEHEHMSVMKLVVENVSAVKPSAEALSDKKHVEEPFSACESTHKPVALNAPSDKVMSVLSQREETGPIMHQSDKSEETGPIMHQSDKSEETGPIMHQSDKSSSVKKSSIEPAPVMPQRYDHPLIISESDESLSVIKQSVQSASAMQMIDEPIPHLIQNDKPASVMQRCNESKSSSVISHIKEPTSFDVQNEELKSFEQQCDEPVTVKQQIEELKSFEQQCDEPLTVKQQIEELKSFEQQCDEPLTVKQQIEELKSFEQQCDEPLTVKQQIEELKSFEQQCDELLTVKQQIEELKSFEQQCDELLTVKQQIEELKSFEQQCDEPLTVKQQIEELASVTNQIEEFVLVKMKSYKPIPVKKQKDQSVCVIRLNEKPVSLTKQIDELVPVISQSDMPVHPSDDPASFMKHSDEHNPVTSHSDEHNPVISHSDEHNLVTSHSDEHNPVTSHSDEHYPVTSHSDEHNPVISHLDEHNPVTSHSDEHNPVTSHSDEHNPVISHSDEHNPVISHSDEHNLVTSHSDEHNPVTSHSDEHNPVTSHSDEHNPVISHSDEHNPVTSHSDEHNPVISHSDEHNPVISQSDMPVHLCDDPVSLMKQTDEHSPVTSHSDPSSITSQNEESGCIMKNNNECVSVSSHSDESVSFVKHYEGSFINISNFHQIQSDSFDKDTVAACNQSSYRNSQDSDKNQELQHNQMYSDSSHVETKVNFLKLPEILSTCTNPCTELKADELSVEQSYSVVQPMLSTEKTGADCNILSYNSCSSGDSLPVKLTRDSCSSADSLPVQLTRDSCSSADSLPVHLTCDSCSSADSLPVHLTRDSCSSADSLPVHLTRASCSSADSLPVHLTRNSCSSGDSLPVKLTRDSCSSADSLPVQLTRDSCSSADSLPVHLTCDSCSSADSLPVQLTHDFCSSADSLLVHLTRDSPQVKLMDHQKTVVNQSDTVDKKMLSHANESNSEGVKKSFCDMPSESDGGLVYRRRKSDDHSTIMSTSLKLSDIDSRIKRSLSVDHSSISECLAAMEEVDHIPITPTVIAKNPDFMLTIKKCRRYKGSDKVRAVADQIYVKCKHVCLDVEVPAQQTVYEAKESAIETLSSTYNSYTCKDTTSNNQSISRKFICQPRTSLQEHFSADDTLSRSMVHSSDGKISNAKLLNRLGVSESYNKHAKVITSSSSHHCKLDQDPVRSVDSVCSVGTHSLSQSGLLASCGNADTSNCNITEGVFSRQLCNKVSCSVRRTTNMTTRHQLAQFGTAETKQSDMTCSFDTCNKETLTTSSVNSRFMCTSADKFSSSRETQSRLCWPNTTVSSSTVVGSSLCWPNTTVSSSTVIGSLIDSTSQEFVSCDIKRSPSSPLELVLAPTWHSPCHDAISKDNELWEAGKDRDNVWEAGKDRDDVSDISFGNDVEEDLDFNGNVSNDKSDLEARIAQIIAEEDAEIMASIMHNQPIPRVIPWYQASCISPCSLDDDSEVMDDEELYSLLGV